jgi:hypothetical protein
MDFVSIRIITGDVARLVAFYEKATGVQANWSTEDFAELTRATLAIGSTLTTAQPPGRRLRAGAPGSQRSPGSR